MRWLGWLVELFSGIMGHRAYGRPKTTLSARVIRADGTIEDLGVISKNGRRVRRSRA